MNPKRQISKSISCDSIPAQLIEPVITILGVIWPWKYFNIYHKLYFIISSFSIIFSIILSLISFKYFSVFKPDFTISLLLLWTSICAFFHLFKSIFKASEIDLIVSAIINITIFFVFLFYFLFGQQSGITIIWLTLLGTTGFANVSFAITIFIKCPVYPPPGFRNFPSFNKFGDSDQIRRFLIYLFYNLQLSITTILFIFKKGPGNATTYELILVPIGIAFAIAYTLLGNLSARYEKNWMVILFYLVGLPHFLFIAYDMYKYGTEEFERLSIPDGIFNILDLCTRILTIYKIKQVQKNFGKGYNSWYFKRIPISNEKHEVKSFSDIIVSQVEQELK